MEAVLQRAVDAGVKKIYLPAIDWSSLNAMQKLVHPDITFYKMAGIHPCEVQNNWPLDEKRLYDVAREEEYVAIGESGLDYYWNTDFISMQKKSLSIHCEAAKAVNKPLILHNRESTSDLLDLVETQQDGSLKGIWHCFNGSIDEGKRALDLGLYLGIGGVLTFKNAGVDKIVKQLPLDRMLLETDAPYLAPEPNRGKRNEPFFVFYIAEKLAELMEMPVEDIAGNNAKCCKSISKKILKLSIREIFPGFQAPAYNTDAHVSVESWYEFPEMLVVSSQVSNQ